MPDNSIQIKKKIDGVETDVYPVTSANLVYDKDGVTTVQTKIDALNTNLASKAPKSTTLSGYGITDAMQYIKNEGYVFPTRIFDAAYDPEQFGSIEAFLDYYIMQGSLYHNIDNVTLVGNIRGIKDGCEGTFIAYKWGEIGEILSAYGLFISNGGTYEYVHNYGSSIGKLNKLISNSDLDVKTGTITSLNGSTVTYQLLRKSGKVVTLYTLLDVGTDGVVYNTKYATIPEDFRPSESLAYIPCTLRKPSGGCIGSAASINTQGNIVYAAATSTDYNQIIVNASWITN